jgi:NAD(P)-dependent dehydrogenase (short-subunit alcohol dehydrogenase family)
MEKRAQLIPIGRPASPSEIADFIYWHGSEENTYVTGQVTAISGGE